MIDVLVSAGFDFDLAVIIAECFENG